VSEIIRKRRHTRTCHTIAAMISVHPQGFTTPCFRRAVHDMTRKIPPGGSREKALLTCPAKVYRSALEILALDDRFDV
jgi:hypothetical protein